MTTIEKWRTNAGLSRPAMSKLMLIPVRTIENWESETRTPPAYVERFVINELKQHTKECRENIARQHAEDLGLDKDGNPPIIAWCILSEAQRLIACDSFMDALVSAETCPTSKVTCLLLDQTRSMLFTNAEGVIAGAFMEPLLL